MRLRRFDPEDRSDLGDRWVAQDRLAGNKDDRGVVYVEPKGSQKLLGCEVAFDVEPRDRDAVSRQQVKDLTRLLKIADREFMVLVGPLSCGKTTALRMVGGLEEITSGTISIGARIVNKLSPMSRDIAMVFQSYALYPHLSVADNIGFALKIRRVPKEEIRRRVLEIARMLDLEPYLERKVRALSGGQRQHVAMGRAIIRQPQAFLMDEPLSNLDAKLRVQMRAEIKELQSALGVTTIYVTNDQVEAMTTGDRVAVMRKGVLQRVASPEELYQRPQNVFVGGSWAARR